MRRTLLVLLLGLFLPINAAIGQSSAPPAGPSATDGDYIILTSGETIRGDIEFFPGSGLPRYATAHGQRYTRGQIASYRSNGHEYVLSHSYGPEPILLVKKESGHVSVYEEARQASGIQFFRVGNGELDLASGRNLRQAFAHDPAAMQHLRRERMYGYVGMSALAAGAALVAAGTVLEIGNLDGPSGFVVAGSGVALAVSVNAAVPLLQQQARRSAIRTYNNGSAYAAID